MLLLMLALPLKLATWVASRFLTEAAVQAEPQVFLLIMQKTLEWGVDEQPSLLHAIESLDMRTVW